MRPMKTIDQWILAAFVLLASFSMMFGGCHGIAGPAAAAAQEAPDPDLAGEVVIVWEDSTRLALGQCFVAEAGWRNHTEHAAMAFVLRRRWLAYNAAHPDAPITFEQEIRQYCHVHRVARERSSNGWALGLTWGPLETDPRLPTDPRPMCTEDGCWRRYTSRWDVVRESVLAFERGELRDPMPLAILWGSAMDSGGNAPSLAWLGPTVRSASAVDDEGNPLPVRLANRFYARRSEIARAARTRAQ